MPSRFSIMRRRTKRLPASLLALLAVAAAVLGPWQARLHPDKVVFVYDGDTVRLASGQKVRYIGVDTPERGQLFYGEAKRFNASLVFGKQVELEFDAQQKDRYGRLLAYVYVEKDGKRVMVNEELVRQGYAQAYTVPPNVKYAERFVALQRRAFEERRGLWAKESVGGASSPAAAQDAPPTASSVVGNRRSLTFHLSSCPLAQRMNPQNRTHFRSRQEAIKAGYHPCRTCRP